MTSAAVTTRSAPADTVPTTYDEAVRALAAAHAAGWSNVDIYLLPDPQRRVVRLIEVSDDFPEGGVDRPAATGDLERVVPPCSPWARPTISLSVLRSSRSRTPSGTSFAGASCGSTETGAT